MDKLYVLLATLSRFVVIIRLAGSSIDILSADYIFILDPPNRPSSILSLLRPHKTEDIHPGLPKMGVSGSDHVSLAAEIRWTVDDS